MQIHPPTALVRDGEFTVSLHDRQRRFAVISLGNTDMFMESTEDCDRLIRAAVRAKATFGEDPLDPVTRATENARPVVFGETLCGVHSAPIKTSGADSYYTCGAQAGHTGDHVAFWGDGSPRYRWAQDGAQ